MGSASLPASDVLTMAWGGCFPVFRNLGRTLRWAYTGRLVRQNQSELAWQRGTRALSFPLVFPLRGLEPRLSEHNGMFSVHS